MSAVPNAIEDYLALLGEEGTLRLVEAQAGVLTYIPRNPRGTKLGELLGEEAAAEFCRAFGGSQVVVPSVKAWRVRLYEARGVPVSEIARRTGLSERAVYRILAKPNTAPRRLPQGDLFRS